MKRQYEINAENKISVSPLIILLLSLYTVWQMGVMFYSGTSLSIGGRTPIPVAEPYTTIMIAAGYVVTIVFHMAFYRYTLTAGKIAAAASLIATVLLFTPLDGSVLAVAFYVAAFCCTFLIGTTYSIEAGLYDNSCVLRSNLWGTLIFCALVTLIQNDFYRPSFLVFNVLSTLILICVLIGYFLLPKRIETKHMTFKQAKEQRKLPKWMLLGLYVSPFVSTALIVFSSVVAESVKHGLFILYGVGALTTAVWIFVYKRFKVSPFKISTVAFALSIIGFALAALSTVYKPLVYFAIVLMGGNVLVANMIGFFANTAFVYSPTRTAGSGLIICGFTIAMLQAGLLELFRDNMSTLFAVISAIATLFSVFYLLVEPHLSYRFKVLQASTAATVDTPPETPSDETPVADDSPLHALSPRDRQIVELILTGYTVPEIAKELFYSEESIKTYKKNIYAELDVHSKRELFSLVGKK